MSHVIAEVARHRATMSRAESVIRSIVDACNEGELTDEVWDAATEAMSALSHLRHVLWEVAVREWTA